MPTECGMLVYSEETSNVTSMAPLAGKKASGVEDENV